MLVKHASVTVCSCSQKRLLDSVGRLDAMVATLHQLRPHSHKRQTQGSPLEQICASLSVLQPALVQQVRLQQLQSIAEELL